MREILFRAKRVDNGEWVDGYPVKYPSGKVVIFKECGEPPDILLRCEINPETLCQYTGLKDKNGNRIWENDIVKHDVSGTIGTVKWYQEDYVGWCVDDIVIDEQQFTDEMWSECEIVGNVFDGGIDGQKAKEDLNKQEED